MSINLCNTSSESLSPATQQRLSAIRLSATHLTDDQFDDHLLGDLTATAAAHLRDCPLCTERAAEASAPFADFNAVSLEWSERRSATSPMPAFAAQPVLWQRRLVWACAMASFAVGLGITNAARFLRPTQEISTASVSSSTTGYPAAQPAALSASQIADDNRMLSAIDRELEPAAETPATLGLEPVGTSAPRAHAYLIQD